MSEGIRLNQNIVTDEYGRTKPTGTTVGGKHGMDVNILNPTAGGNAMIVDEFGNKIPLVSVDGVWTLPVQVRQISINASDDSIETRKLPMKTAIDEPAPGLTYIGRAAPGTLLGSAGWRLEKITVSGTVTLIELADGGQFNQIWNNRASLTYS